MVIKIFTLWLSSSLSAANEFERSEQMRRKMKQADKLEPRCHKKLLSYATSNVSPGERSRFSMKPSMVTTGASCPPTRKLCHLMLIAIVFTAPKFNVQAASVADDTELSKTMDRSGDEELHLGPPSLLFSHQAPVEEHRLISQTQLVPIWRPSSSSGNVTTRANRSNRSEPTPTTIVTTPPPSELISALNNQSNTVVFSSGGSPVARGISSRFGSLSYANNNNLTTTLPPLTTTTTPTSSPTTTTTTTKLPLESASARYKWSLYNEINPNDTTGSELNRQLQIGSMLEGKEAIQLASLPPIRGTTSLRRARKEDETRSNRLQVAGSGSAIVEPSSRSFQPLRPYLRPATPQSTVNQAPSGRHNRHILLSTSSSSSSSPRPPPMATTSFAARGGAGSGAQFLVGDARLLASLGLLPPASTSSSSSQPHQLNKQSNLDEFLVSSSGSTPSNELETTLLGQSKRQGDGLHQEPIVTETASEASSMDFAAASSNPSSSSIGNPPPEVVDSNAGNGPLPVSSPPPASSSQESDELDGSQEPFGEVYSDHLSPEARLRPFEGEGDRRRGAQKPAASGPLAAASNKKAVSQQRSPSAAAIAAAEAERELLVGPFKSESEAPATITLSGVVYQKSGSSSSIIKTPAPPPPPPLPPLATRHHQHHHQQQQEASEQVNSDLFGSDLSLNGDYQRQLMQALQKASLSTGDDPASESFTFNNGKMHSDTSELNFDKFPWPPTLLTTSSSLLHEDFQRQLGKLGAPPRPSQSQQHQLGLNEAILSALRLPASQSLTATEQMESQQQQLLLSQVASSSGSEKEIPSGENLLTGLDLSSPTVLNSDGFELTPKQLAALKESALAAQTLFSSNQQQSQSEVAQNEVQQQNSSPAANNKKPQSAQTKKLQSQHRPNQSQNHQIQKTPLASAAAAASEQFYLAAASSQLQHQQAQGGQQLQTDASQGLASVQEGKKGGPIVIVQKDVKPVKYHLLRAYLKLRRLLRPFEATYVFPPDPFSSSNLTPLLRRRQQLSQPQTGPPPLPSPLPLPLPMPLHPPNRHLQNRPTTNRVQHYNQLRPFPVSR